MVLGAVESLGLLPDGRLLALNSYENRVYRVGLEEALPSVTPGTVAGQVVAKFYRAGRWSDDEAAQETMKAKAPANVAADFKTIEDQIKGPFVLGPDYSLADAYLFVFVRWGRNMTDMSAYPKVMAVHDAVAARPATRKALADEGLG